MHTLHQNFQIVVGSKNPVKINATGEGLRQMFPEHTFEVTGYDARSGVPDQPRSDEETLRGATNRANEARKNSPTAEFAVGIEGGIEDRNGSMMSFAWVVITHNNGVIGKAKTATFFLPQEVRQLILNGKELGVANDILFGRTHSKHSEGAVGILTRGIIDRTQYYTDAVILALIPFLDHDTVG